ncbi:hypothetical protein D3C81_11510 [compost metagenome]
MIIGKKFRGKEVIERAGVLDKVLVEVGHGTPFGWIDISVEDKILRLREGNSVVILTDYFGIHASVNASAFLVDDGVCIELHEGEIFLKDEEKNIIYSVNSMGEIKYYSEEFGNNQVWWVKESSFKYNLEASVRNHYHLDDLLAGRYTANLAFEIDFKRVDNGGGTFGATLSTKPKFLEAFALNLFKFIMFTKKEVATTSDYEDEPLDEEVLDEILDDEDDEDAF